MVALLDFANEWIKKGGLIVLALIVFAESGLLVGFFLPGDSLLFFAGFLASDAGGHVLPGGLPAVAAVAVVAAIVGDQVGYLFGHKIGPALFNRPRSRLFNPEHVAKAEHFFDKYGSKTILLARFVPVVRTFAPIVAGVGKMKYHTFVTYNVIGGLLWGAGITTLGYFLGKINFIKHNIEVAAIVVVAISLAPVVIEYIRHRRNSRATSTDEILVEDSSPQ
ncbi:MAG: VTT domain-containing protein [Ilumatobacteraceae bacterium]